MCRSRGPRRLCPRPAGSRCHREHQTDLPYPASALDPPAGFAWWVPHGGQGGILPDLFVTVHPRASFETGLLQAKTSLSGGGIGDSNLPGLSEAGTDPARFGTDVGTDVGPDFDHLELFSNPRMSVCGQASGVRGLGKGLNLSPGFVHCLPLSKRKAYFKKRKNEFTHNLAKPGGQLVHPAGAQKSTPT